MVCARHVTGYGYAKVFILVVPTNLWYDGALPWNGQESRRLRIRGLGWIQDQPTWHLW
jgi:hypothetical protein